MKRESDGPGLGEGRGPGKMSVANSDGWQWRKYGEKMVKGSINPRSYYKCSHAGCTAKKIVERDDAGNVISTEYKGDHSHPAPHSAKAPRFRPKQAKPDLQPSSQPPPPLPIPTLSAPPPISGPIMPTVNPSSRAAALNTTLPAASLLGLSGLQLGLLPFSGLLNIPSVKTEPQGNQLAAVNKPASEDEDSDESSEEEEEELIEEPMPMRVASTAEAQKAHKVAALLRKVKSAQNSPSSRLDALAEEAERELNIGSSGLSPGGPAAKRQRLANGSMHAPGGRRRTTALAGGVDDEDMESPPLVPLGSRVVEVASIEDGFKWRKYGQKQVKGSPHPRSYYKCTHPGCTVRKHVERSVDDDTKFLITYEGTHTHAPPASGSRRRVGPTEGLPEPGTFEEEGEEDADEEEVDEQPIASPPPNHLNNILPGLAGLRGLNAALSLQAASMFPLLPMLPALSAASLASGMEALAQVAISTGMDPKVLGKALAAEAVAMAAGPLAAAHLSASAHMAAGTLGLEALQQLLGRGAAQPPGLGGLLGLPHLGPLSSNGKENTDANGWDPLACLITPRPRLSSPGNGTIAAVKPPPAGEHD